MLIEEEPGIGESRLLLELAQIAASERSVVLDARASEFERDLPFALWSEAIDRHLRKLGDRHVRLLGIDDPHALTVITSAVEGERDADPISDRHRTQRALRDLLERMAAAPPLAVCLDDVHWADVASVDALSALVRRPPAAQALVALTSREAQLPASLARAVAVAVAMAMVEDRAARIGLSPLSRAEADQLVGADVTTSYPLSGGSPFYLQQLARVPAQPAVAHPWDLGPVPVAVAASLSSELGELSPPTRLLIEAASVLGDPFEPDLAAEVAELDERTGLLALDDLLAHTLVRPAGAPRRFAFRHPLVRQAVYETSAGGWRLGAHARAGRALERRGAGVVVRAHHVDQAANAADETAIALFDGRGARVARVRPGERCGLLQGGLTATAGLGRESRSGAAFGGRTG